MRVRGGNKKYRALRLDVGNFSWGSECKYLVSLMCWKGKLFYSCAGLQYCYRVEGDDASVDLGLKIVELAVVRLKQHA